MYTTENTPASTLLHNQKLLVTFKVGDNIVVFDNECIRCKRYGHVVGFVMNESHRLLLRVQFAVLAHVPEELGIEIIEAYDPRYKVSVLKTT